MKVEVESVPTKATWNKYFDLIPQTGRLFWAIDHANYKEGDEARNPNALGYNRVGLNKKRYRARRVIWEMLYGRIPEGFMVSSIYPDNGCDQVAGLYIWNKTKKTGFIANGDFVTKRFLPLGEYQEIIKKRSLSKKLAKRLK